MYIDERIKTIQELAKLFKTSDKKNIPADFSPLMDQWENAVCKEHFYHSWFIPEFIHEAVAALTQMMLGTDGHALEQWTEAFRPALEEKKKIPSGRRHHGRKYSAGGFPRFSVHFHRR